MESNIQGKNKKDKGKEKKEKGKKKHISSKNVLYQSTCEKI